jgi:hypothetical protein
VTLKWNEDVSDLRISRRRLAMKKAAATLEEMKQRGVALHLSYTRSGKSWVLSDGRRVDSDVADLVTASASVAPVGDCLFAGAASQTLRWWSNDPHE